MAGRGRPAPLPWGREFLKDKELNLSFEVKGASGLTAIPLVAELALIHGKNFSDTEIGIEVNEDTGFQYQPEQSTSALICHHPQAKYFVAR